MGRLEADHAAPAGGVELVGRRFDDARLLQPGATLERALGFRPAG